MGKREDIVEERLGRIAKAQYGIDGGQVPRYLMRCLEWWESRHEKLRKLQSGDDDNDGGEFGTYFGPLTEDETADLKALDPELWWTKVVGVGGDDHQKRCPGCGKRGIRVGSKFRVPGKSDKKEWWAVEQMVESGVDMVAAFESCATVEEYNELVVEADRRFRAGEVVETWIEEKDRRLQALGLMGQLQAKQRIPFTIKS